MNAEGVERVVVLTEWFETDGAVTDHAGDETYGEGAERSNVSRSRGDGDQPGDDAGSQTQRGRLSLMYPFNGHPAKSGRGRRHLRRRQGRGGQSIASQGAAAVEAEP